MDLPLELLNGFLNVFPGNIVEIACGQHSSLRVHSRRSRSKDPDTLILLNISLNVDKLSAHLRPFKVLL